MVKSGDQKNNRAAILFTGEEAFDARIRIIENAKTSIIISSYLFGDDKSGHMIAASLMAAADRGVTVQVIIDGFMGSVHLDKSLMGYVLGAHSNMALRYYNPFDLWAPTRINARHHEKFMLADQDVMVFGGRNISDEFLTSRDHPAYNDDLDILIFNSSPVEKSLTFTLREYFERMWSGLCTPVFTQVPADKKEAVEEFEAELGSLYTALCLQRPELTAPADWTNRTVPIDGLALLLNPTQMTVKEPVVWVALIGLMKAAKERVWIQTPYIVLNKSMYRDLAAISQGPADVAVLINSRASGNNIIASADFVIQQKNVKNLALRLFEFQGPTSVHTKAILIDNSISVFGSFNVDIRSVYINTESALVVYSRQINSMLEKHMKTMFAQAAPFNSIPLEEGLDNSLPRLIEPDKDLKIRLMAPFIWLIRTIV